MQCRSARLLLYQ